MESITGIVYWTYPDDYPGATWLADLTNGCALAGINADENVVGLNICPGDYHLWRGDGWILMSNAIRYRMGDRPAVRELSWGAIKAEF